MFHERFLRIIDYSLLPLSIVILAKVFGLYLIFHTLNIDWGVADFPNSTISVTPLVFGRDLSIVSTYSNIVLYFVLLASYSVQFILSNLQYRQYKQMLLVKIVLFLNNLKLYKSGAEVYLRSFVWYAFLVLVTIYLVYDAIMGHTALWLPIVAFLFTGALGASLLKTHAQAEQQEAVNPHTMAL